MRDKKIAEIEITNNCNLRCIFCPREHLLEEGSMDHRIFKKIITKLKKEKYVGVYICGFGEPLLHYHLPMMIKYVKQMGLRLGISTNGILMKEKTIRKSILADVDRIDVNLPSLNEKKYEFMCKGAVFKDVKRNIGYLFDYGNKVSVHINTVVTNLNLREIEDIILWGSKKGARGNLVPYSNRGIERSCNPKLKLKDHLNKQIIDSFLNQFWCCSFLFDNYIFIGWDGYVYSCPADINKSKKICFFLDASGDLMLKKKRESKFWHVDYCKKCRKFYSIVREGNFKKCITV